MTTYTSQPDDTIGVDSYITSAAATTNYGTSAILNVGKDSTDTFRSLLKFDLSSIPGSSTIISAVLTIYIKTDYANRASTWACHRLLRAWTEAGVTWNKYDGTNSWTTPGGMGAGDCEAADIGTASVGAAEVDTTPIAISLTPAKVLEMINGTLTNNGFLIKATETPEDLYQCYSSGGTAAYRPKLVIEHLGGAVILWSSN